MVRNAEEKDLKRIAEIIIFGKRTAYRPIFQNDEVSFNELSVVDLYNELLGSPEIWKNMLVYDDGIVKSVIGYVPTDEDDTAELNNFYAEPFFKGCGIGRKTIDGLFRELKPRYRKIVLWVIKENSSAISFYEKNGFCATGKERIIPGTEKLDKEYVKIL